MGFSFGNLLDPLTSAINLTVGQGGKGFGNVLNNITGTTSQQNKTYQQQMAAMDKQNAYNQAMWNLQNEYNSPSAQLARMHDAGIDINPTSYALGTGNLSNTAVHVGAESGFAGSGSPAGNPISMLLGMVNGLQGVKESQARVSSIGVDNAIKRHNLKYAQDTDTPVGQMPGLETTLVSIGKKTLQGEGPIGNLIKGAYSKAKDFVSSRVSSAELHKKSYDEWKNSLDNAYKSGKISRREYIDKLYF